MQGYRSYIIAEDIDRGEVIGCCQINRIQVGGYLYLTDDLILKNLYVKEGYRGCSSPSSPGAPQFLEGGCFRANSRQFESVGARGDHENFS